MWDRLLGLPASFFRRFQVGRLGLRLILNIHRRRGVADQQRPLEGQRGPARIVLLGEDDDPYEEEPSVLLERSKSSMSQLLSTMMVDKRELDKNLSVRAKQRRFHIEVRHGRSDRSYSTPRCSGTKALEGEAETLDGVTVIILVVGAMSIFMMASAGNLFGQYQFAAQQSQEINDYVRDVETEVIDLSATVPRDVLVNVEATVGNAKNKVAEVRARADALGGVLTPSYVEEAEGL